MLENAKIKAHDDGGYVKETRESTKRALSSQSWKNRSNKINKVVLNCNLKHKINV